MLHNISPEFPAGHDIVLSLHKAVYEGSYAAVENCLDSGADPNSQLGHSVPLPLAIERGHTDICRRLIKHGADVNFGGKSGKLPLYLAAKRGSKEIVQMLLDAKANLNLPYMTGNTPLLVAASEGDEEIVKLLLEAGSNPTTVNNSGSTGLHMAAYQRNVKLVKIFLKAGVGVNMIQTRARKKRSPSVSVADQKGSTPLHLVAMSPEEEGRSFVPECIETLNVLLEAGANVNAALENGRTALHLAASKNCTNIANVLLKHGCEVDPISTENDEFKTPLHKAVDLGHVAMTQTLIDAGANLDFGDRWGVTPLYTAVFSNNIPIARLLMRHGSDVNSVTKNHSTPFAASLRHPPIITKMLLLSGCMGSLQEFLLSTQSLTTYSEEQANEFRDVRDWIISFMENPKQLQQLCREVVRRALVINPTDKIATLPVPNRLRGYLNLCELDSMA